MYYIEEEQVIEQWIIQIPLTFILLEIIAICIVRCILAFLTIRKYKRKRFYYHQALIMDSSYFAGAPSYVDKYLEDSVEKENAIRKAAISTPVPEKLNKDSKNITTDNKVSIVKAATAMMKATNAKKQNKF
ncbi:unnamed protein product [Cercopithifilaria johnstoni]|uniref:Uncharacterized protein n=1 Tax=Cercopithifilaria johnstoni TaxID=2874296 RepID=A0A8J2LWY1_9BILA|nr:unnamed protein product [Cercopithifilaria johnstoni]